MVELLLAYSADVDMKDTVSLLSHTLCAEA